MAKTETVTKTKTATQDATEQKTRRSKADKEEKPKRSPSAYQVFVKANLKAWNEANPGRSKEIMSQMALLWKDAPENPNRGEGKARKPKEPSSKPSKAAPKSKKKATKKSEADEEEAEGEDFSEQDVVAPSSDG